MIHKLTQQHPRMADVTQAPNVKTDLRSEEKACDFGRNRDCGAFVEAKENSKPQSSPLGVQIVFSKR